MNQNIAYGIGLATFSEDTLVDVWYPQPLLENTQKQLDTNPSDLKKSLFKATKSCAIRNTHSEVIETELDTNEAPNSTADTYLRLHLLSHRLVKPNSINLEGIFSLLPNVIWTHEGAMLAADYTSANLRLLQLYGRPLQVLSVDKFPQMLNYVVPTGVRIANGANVRLGAYLSPGTTVMHAGFVNFNAGTLGQAMVEGRISQGVVIDDGSDIGGGASTMGTLSGGGKERVRIGKNCLLGANAGIGIALGDNCLVEAGLYVTAGTKVTIIESGKNGSEKVVKAREISGICDVIFRRNSCSGRVEVVPRGNTEINLNNILHATN